MCGDVQYEGQIDLKMLRYQWNQPSIDFYDKTLGAKAMSDWMGMRLDEQGIDNLKKFVVSPTGPS